MNKKVDMMIRRVIQLYVGDRMGSKRGDTISQKQTKIKQKASSPLNAVSKDGIINPNVQ